MNLIAAGYLGVFVALDQTARGYYAVPRVPGCVSWSFKLIGYIEEQPWTVP